MATKQQLEENRVELQDQVENHTELMEHHRMNVIAFRGALQNCEYLIDLDDEEPESAPASVEESPPE